MKKLFLLFFITITAFAGPLINLYKPAEIYLDTHPKLKKLAGNAFVFLKTEKDKDIWVYTYINPKLYQSYAKEAGVKKLGKKDIEKIKKLVAHTIALKKCKNINPKRELVWEYIYPNNKEKSFSVILDKETCKNYFKN